MDFLERLREKSIGERRVIAFASAGIIVLIIFIVWVSTLASRLSVDEDIVSSESTAEESSFIQGTKDGVQSIIDKTKDTSFFKEFGKPVEYKREQEEPESPSN